LQHLVPSILVKLGVQRKRTELAELSILRRDIFPNATANLGLPKLSLNISPIPKPL
jgi:hypothetical protein